jgi:PTH2 family peptidyl-tRNA hydrolase
MGKGKLAAQCGHGVLGAYKRSLLKQRDNLKRWMRGGQAKVVVKVKDEEEL